MNTSRITVCKYAYQLHLNYLNPSASLFLRWYLGGPSPPLPFSHWNFPGWGQTPFFSQNRSTGEFSHHASADDGSTPFLGDYPPSSLLHAVSCPCRINPWNNWTSEYTQGYWPRYYFWGGCPTNTSKHRTSWCNSTIQTKDTELILGPPSDFNYAHILGYRRVNNHSLHSSGVPSFPGPTTWPE